MKRTTLCCWLALPLIAALAGCGSGSQDAPAPSATPGPAVGTTTYLLPSEPAGVKNVAEVRKTAKDGDPVVVAGRVGGSEGPFVDGLAAFTLVDLSLKPCGGPDDPCPTPWDYCCEKDVAANSTLVKVVDPNGNPIETGAKQLLGVQGLSEVVVRGKAKVGQPGSVSIVADGVFIRTK